MALEEDLAESDTSSPAASTRQLSRAARPRASENLRCPICLDAINNRASVSWRRHPFCFYCMVEWWHRRVESLTGQLPFPHTFHMVGDSNSEVFFGESSSASHSQGGQAESRSVEKRQHRSLGRQHRKSSSESRGGNHAGSRGGSRGGSCTGSRGGNRAGSHGGSRGGSHGGSRAGSRAGSRGRAQDKSRSRYPRKHHEGRSRVQQAQGYNSSSRRRRQSRAQNTARARGRAPRTKRPARAFSRTRKRRQQEYQVCFVEPRAIRSRSRRRSRSTGSQTLKEYLRKMERDEGRALRQDCYIRASSRRSRRPQRGRRVSYRESQVTRSRTPRRLRSTLTLKENPRRMEHYERQPLRIDPGIRASPRRSERLQQGHQVSFIQPQLSRSQSRGRSHSTQHQSLQETLMTMERDEGQAPRPEQDTPTSSGWSEHHQQGCQAGFTESQEAGN